MVIVVRGERFEAKNVKAQMSNETQMSKLKIQKEKSRGNGKASSERE